MVPVQTTAQGFTVCLLATSVHSPPARPAAHADVCHPSLCIHLSLHLALNMARQRPMRVKSVHPPQKPPSELFLAVLMFVAAAALDSQPGRDLWEWLSISAGGPKEATVLTILVVPNIVYYFMSAIFAFLDLCVPDHPFVKSAKVQPVR